MTESAPQPPGTRERPRENDRWQRSEHSPREASAWRGRTPPGPARLARSSADESGTARPLGVPAAALVRDGNRLTGVALADGDRIIAGRVIVAAGCWSGQLAGLPRALPVFPVRLQMVAVQSAPPVLGRVVQTLGCYLIPRSGQRILVGATAEQAGFHSHTTPRGIAFLLREAVATVPVLAGAPIAEVWAGLRPATPDSLPILGSDPEVDGLYYATGHYRNGILLAPITAEAMADVLTGRTPPVPLDAFGPGRFGPADDRAGRAEG